MDETTKLMQGIAKVLDGALNGETVPKQAGFVVLLFPLGGPEGARTNYVSNCDRKDIVVAMKEVIARFEGQPYQTGNA